MQNVIQYINDFEIKKLNFKMSIDCFYINLKESNVTFFTSFYTLQNRIANAQECDARMFNSCNTTKDTYQQLLHYELCRFIFHM